MLKENMKIWHFYLILFPWHFFVHGTAYSDSSCTQVLSDLLTPSNFKLELPEPSGDLLTRVDATQKLKWINAHTGKLREIAERIANSIYVPSWESYKRELFDLMSPLFSPSRKNSTYILYDRIDKSQAYFGALVHSHFKSDIPIISTMGDNLSPEGAPNWQQILNSINPGDEITLAYIDDGLYSGTQFAGFITGNSKIFSEIQSRGATIKFEAYFHSVNPNGLKKVTDQMGKADLGFDIEKFDLNIKYVRKMQSILEVVEDFIEEKSTSTQADYWSKLLEIFNGEMETLRGELDIPLTLMPHKIPDGFSFKSELKRGAPLADWGWKFNWGEEALEEVSFISGQQTAVYSYSINPELLDLLKSYFVRLVANP